MRILALAVPLVVTSLVTGLAGCSAGRDNYASMTTSGVGFNDYQRFLRDRENSVSYGGSSRSSIPYSVPPQSYGTAQAPILPPSSMPANAPSTLDAVPMRPLSVSAGAVASAPMAAPGSIASQTLAPVGTPLAAPMAPPAVPATPVSSAPMATASFGAAETLAAAAPQSGIRDAQTYHADAATPQGARGAGPAPATIVAASIPPPSEDGGANLMEYALSVSHAPGTEVYRRLNPMRFSSWQNNCLRFRNQDAAQRAFLEAGGPDRDRDNLDPDGDGFACWWDPTPLRQAALRR